MLAWLTYAVVVSSLAGLGAAAAGRVLRLYGLPARGAWVAGVLVSVAVPLAAHVTGGAPVIASAVPVPAVGEAVSALGRRAGDAAAAADGTALGRLETALGWAWAAASAAGLLWLAASAFRLRRALDGFPARTVGGVTVHRTEEEGPACWGLPGGRARVLLPSWLRELEPELRRIAVEHERHHLRRGDSLLVAGGCLVLAALPWNLPLWWQVLRLRRAVELDCDGRVLGSGTDPRDYGELLLTVGGRRAGAGSPWTAVPLSERTTGVEGRIRRMVEPPARHRLLRAAAFTVVALGAGALACETTPPGPDAELDAARAGEPTSPDVRAPAGESAEEAPSAERSRERPTFIPYDVAPELQNPDEVEKRLRDVYPASLESAGIGGSVVLWLRVDERGSVRASRIRESSGYRALDRAAEDVVEAMEFSPALNRDQPRAVWVQQRIVFRAPSEASPEDGGDG